MTNTKTQENINMKEYIVHIPTAQYEFVEVKAKSAEEAKQLRDEVLEAFQEPKNTPNSGLDKITMLRLLHKYLTTNMLELEDIEGLGADKIYSQKDVLGLIKNVLAKITRDEGGSRAESSHRMPGFDKTMEDLNNLTIR